MTTKRDAKVARANLWVTRRAQKNQAGSAQVRAFKAREIAKQRRDLVARKLASQQAADAAKKARANGEVVEGEGEVQTPQDDGAPSSAAEPQDPRT